MGFAGAIGVRLLGWRLGMDVTTSGCSLVFSVRSIKDMMPLEATETVGAENTRTASALHTGQATWPVAWPIGRRTSTKPSRLHE